MLRHPQALVHLAGILICRELCVGQSQETETTTKTTVNTFIKLDVPAKYLKGARWEIDTKNPKQIFHSIEITDISRISVESGEFRLDLNLRQRWTEENLIFPTGLFMDNETGDEYVTADAEVLDALWVPDLYFPNARSSVIEGLEAPHSNVLIFKNKTVLYYATLTATLGCPMEFQWYPLDIQRCPLYIESYTYARKKVIFAWENITAAVILADELRPRRYALLRPVRWYSGVHTRFGRADLYSRITIMFVFERELSQNLIQVYIPTFLIVSLSWFSFWLGLDAIPGRVGLLVTCMLTLVTMYTGLKVDIPPVEYIKILDIWMAACLLFVFAAMSEFVVVRTISHMHKAKNEVHANHQSQQQREQEANEIKSPSPAFRVIPTILLNSEKLETGTSAIRPYREFYSRETGAAAVAEASHARRQLQTQWDHSSNADKVAWAWDIPPSYYDLRMHHQQSQQQNSRTTTGKRDLVQNHAAQIRKHKSSKAKRRRPKSLWEKIDISSRITIPLLFLCFCLVYWPILIFGSQSQKH